MKRIRLQFFGFVAVAGAGACTVGMFHERGARADTAQAVAELGAPDEFATIKDRDERAQAFFLEATRVLLQADGPRPGP